MQVIKKLLAGLITLTLLTGCGNTQSKTDSVKTEENTSTKKETVQLVLWGGEDDEALLEDMIASFQEEYKDQADITITFEAHGESNCKNDLLGDVTQGGDVFTFPDDQLLTLVAAGAIDPVENPNDIASSNIEASVAAASINDILYAYPLTADNGYFLFYNKAYFNDNDILSLDTIMEKAAKAGKQISMDWGGWYLYSFFGNTGLEVDLADDGITTECNWNATDTPITGLDVAKAIYSIAQNPGFHIGSDEQLLEGAEDGTFIAGISGIWYAVALESLWGDNYGTAPLPSYTCNGTQVHMASFAGYKLIGVNFYSKQKEWAHKLAAWITNEENQTLRFEQRGHGPSNINAAGSESVQESAAIQALLAQSEFSHVQRVGANYWAPIEEFVLAMQKPNQTDAVLQKRLDTMVKNITRSTLQ